jgi:hypothetical protein
MIGVGGGGMAFTAELVRTDCCHVLPQGLAPRSIVIAGASPAQLKQKQDIGSALIRPEAQANAASQRTQIMRGQKWVKSVMR